MSDLNHIIYSLTSFLITAIVLVILNKNVREQKHKNLVLKITSLLTVALHYSILYVDYFSTGKAEADATMLLPIYPCHISMWLLVIIAFMKNKDSKLFKILVEFTFYMGLIGGTVGLLFNEIYISNPNLGDYSVLKGLLSHTTLIFNSIYLLSGGYFKIRVSNICSGVVGVAFMVIEGLMIIGLYKLFGLTPPNVMFLLEPPFPAFPWVNTALIVVLALVLLLLFTSLFELFTLPKEERCFTKIINKLNRKEADA